MICRFMDRDNGHRSQYRYFQRLLKLGVESTVEKLAITTSNVLRAIQNRQCYLNAARIAMENPYTYDYVEGIATCILPTEHAWLIDKTYGWVIDPTWVTMHVKTKKPEYKIKDYFGVRIPIELLRVAIQGNETYGPLLPKVIDQIKLPKRVKPLKEPE